MIYWACVVMAIHAMFSVKADLHNLNSYRDGSKCQYAPGLTVGNKTTEEECCKTVVHDYYTKFEPRNRSLSMFLESLQTWNCSQFQHECERRTFDFTDFTSLMYLRFCNRSQMETQCRNDIVNRVKAKNSKDQNTRTFNQLVSKLNLTALTEKDLMNPCVQVATYNSDRTNQSLYYEIIDPIVPFCWFVWCGFNEKVFTTKQVTPWTCMSSR